MYSWSFVLVLAELNPRKYRVLDDCARLRDIIATFPLRRHYIPALFVVHWTEEGKNAPGSDFLDMV